MSDQVIPAGVVLPYDKSEFEAVISRFEQAWHDRGHPAVADFLPAEGPLRAALLAELVQIDIEFRQQRGERCTLADYQCQFPELAAHPSANDPGLQATISRAPDSTASYAGGIAPQPPAMPEEFGRYKILKELGQGAMGAVYLAHDTQLDRQVALKIPKFAGADSAELIKRFYREARASAALRHSNICPVFDVGEIDGRHYITMAYIEGRPLKDFTQNKKPQAEKRAADVIHKITLGLAEAHAHGIIHRDLKPANVMIDAKGEPVVMDFGLAHRASDDVRVTQDGVIIGTPAYMSPEQATGDPQKIGPAADIYSLGVMLYELLTGRLPFTGDLMSVLRQIAVDEPQPPSELRPGLAERLETICLKMMAKKVSDRYRSMDEVSQALGEYIRTSGKDDPQAASSSLAAAKLAASRPIPPWLRHPAVLAGFGSAAALVLLLGIIIYFSMPGGGTLKMTIELPGVEVRVKGTNIVLKGADPEPIVLQPGEKTLIVERGKGPDKFRFETTSLVLKSGQTVTARVELIDGDVRLLADGGEIGRAPLQRPAPTVAGAKANPGWYGWPAAAPPPAIAPFDAEQARQHQEAWAKYLGVPVEHTNSIGMKFRLIPPGEYLRGASNTEQDRALQQAKAAKDATGIIERIPAEGPQHFVRITKPFYLGAHEVTQSQWQTVIGSIPSLFAKTGTNPDYVARVAQLETANHPVENVTWFEATEFCDKLRQTTALQPLHAPTGPAATAQKGSGYRLPTEAEWEFACRAGTTTAYWSGGNEEDMLRSEWINANCGARTHAVGELLANPFGLFDMHGNVREWCEDWWDPTYYQGLPTDDPSGPPAGAWRVNRGGSWSHYTWTCRSAFRSWGGPAQKHSFLGFRVTLSVDVVHAALAQKAEGANRPAKALEPAVAPAAAVAPVPAVAETAAVAPPPAASGNAPFASDREAAEWVLSRGGGVTIAMQQNGREVFGTRGDPVNNNYLELRDVPVQALPALPASPFRLVGARLKNQKVTAADLVRLEGMRLELLGLGGVIKGVNRLTTVGCQIDAAGMEALGRWTELRCLDLFSNPGVTNDSLAHLKLPPLEFLSLQRTGVSDAGLVHLSEMKALKELWLRDLKITDAGMAPLASLPNLEILSVNGSSLTGEFAAHWKGNSQILDLAISTPATRLTREGLKAIASLPKLETLHLHDNCPVQSEWISVLADHPSLKTLYLSGPNLGDEAVVHLKAIPNLESLDVRGAKFSAAALTDLQQSKPDLRILGDAYTSPP